MFCWHDGGMTPAQKRARFRELHAADGVWVMPNPWDVGSARLLANAGFPALATTSAGLSWSLGFDDYTLLTRDVLVGHVEVLAAATDLPLNVDSERLFADTPDGVAETVRMLFDAGAAGCSIEDWDPAVAAIEPIGAMIERVAAAAGAAHRDDDDRMVLTARCEHFLRGVTDLDATIERLVAYRDAGADCLYAPGLSTAAQIRAVVDALDAPVNVLIWPGGPSVAEIGAAGGRRVSTGSGLTSAAYAALMTGARELLDSGTAGYYGRGLTGADRAAFAPPA